MTNLLVSHIWNHMLAEFSSHTSLFMPCASAGMAYDVFPPAAILGLRYVLGSVYLPATLCCGSPIAVAFTALLWGDYSNGRGVACRRSVVVGKLLVDMLYSQTCLEALLVK